MQIARIHWFLRSAPFRPFVIHLSDGSSYEVRHSEFVALGERQVAVTEFVADRAPAYRTAFCDPLHVTQIEVATDKPI